MSQENKADKELLARVIQAPWLSQRPQQEMSELLRRNRDAIGLIFDSNREELWSRDYLDMLMDSGFYDYLQFYHDIDPFSEHYSTSVIMIGGKMYYIINDGITGTYNVKFFKIPGTIPFLFRCTEDGYCYLLPVTTTAEVLIKFIGAKYKSILEPADIGELRNMGPARRDEYVKRTGLDKVVEDPFVKQALRLFDQDVDTYGVMLEFYIVTDTLTGHQQVFTLPIPEEDGNVAYSMAEQILPNIIGQGSLAYDILRLLTSELRDLVEMPGFNIVEQYSLPEIRYGDGPIVWNMAGRGEESRAEYADMLMCLSSKGLLDKLRASGRKDYLKFFTEHLDPSMPYARYGITSLGIDDEYVDTIMEGNNYQGEYDRASLNAAQDEFNNNLRITLNVADSKYEFRSASREFREHAILNNRIAATVRALIFPRDSSLVTGDRRYFLLDDVIWIHTGNEGVSSTHYNIKDLDPILVSQYYPTLKGMFKYRDRLNDAHRILEDLTPLKPSNTHMTIHGVTFKSEEIVCLFYNTPIASAAAIAEEYDPEFMTYKDVKLTADLLNGLIMPYTYYKDLSNTAFEVLSDENTFLYLYSPSYEIDSGFVLGERMVDYLAKFKTSDKHSTFYNSTKTLLTLF